MGRLPIRISILSRRLMPPHVICVGGACILLTPGYCRWFKGARGMEALSRGVSCDTIVNVWIVWQCQYSSVFDGALK